MYLLLKIDGKQHKKLLSKMYLIQTFTKTKNTNNNKKLFTLTGS